MRTLLAALCGLAACTQPNPLVASSPNCSVPDGYATLAGALADPGCQVITIAPGGYEERVELTRDVEIHGTDTTVLDGRYDGPVVTVAAGVHATLVGLTLTHGSGSEGGGIENHGTLVVRSGRVEANGAATGGGIFSDGDRLELDEMVIAANRADVHGGGIAVAAGVLVIRSSEIAGNLVKPDDAQQAVGGGGVWTSVATTLTDVSVAGNDVHGSEVARGGGIEVAAGGELGIDGGELVENHVVIADGAASGVGGGLASAGPVAITRASVINNEVRSTAIAGALTLRGGGIEVTAGAVVLDGVEVAGNRLDAETYRGTETATLAGAGIAMAAAGPSTLALRDSVVGGNVASAPHGRSLDVEVRGGGLAVDGEVAVQIDRTTFHDNRVEAEVASGGAIRLGCRTSCDLVVASSTLANNVSTGHLGTKGGAVAVVVVDGASSTRIENSTVTGNFAEGVVALGAIHIDIGLAGTARLAISSSTIVKNRATPGNVILPSAGGLGFTASNLATGTLTAVVRNTILAANEGFFSDCGASGTRSTTSSDGFNLLGTLGCGLVARAGDIVGGAIAFEELADNGGPTKTVAPTAQTPSRDRGNPAGCRDGAGDLLTVDQRGVARRGICDIGAFEGP